MTRRLVLSYLGLALLILVVLEIPLAVLAARHEQDLTVSQVTVEATGLAAVASEDVEHGRIDDLNAILGRYRARTGAEVAVVDPAGRVIATTSPDKDDDAATDQRSLVQAALSGRTASSFSSDEGKPQGSAAVPISGDSQPEGAVLLSVDASSTEGRIHDIWFALAGFAGGILVLTVMVGMLLARSVSRPLARLESAVTRLGEGNLSARAEADAGPPQVRSLASQFNHMAGRLSELVGAQSRFVADASHQLRSPLTALRLRLENLEAGSTGPSAEGVAAAGREVQRLSRIVDGLLTLSRTDAVEPERRPIDVQEVIDDRCDAWSALAAERPIELVSQRQENRTPYALMVPGDLDQIVDNLLANAVDASPERGRIRVQVVGAEPGWLEIHVTDEGPGMSDDDRRRAFDRFWQGSGSHGGHSGLGLAIVRQLAIRNDGSVELRAAEPTGLVAVLTIATAHRPETRHTARDSTGLPARSEVAADEGSRSGLLSRCEGWPRGANR